MREKGEKEKGEGRREGRSCENGGWCWPVSLMLRALLIRVMQVPLRSADGKSGARG
jgi:hypothetical protein